MNTEKLTTDQLLELAPSRPWFQGENKAKRFTPFVKTNLTQPQVRITFYGHANGRRYNEQFVSDNLEMVLDQLQGAEGAESCVAHIWDGNREKSYAHSQDLRLTCGKPDQRDENKRKLMLAIREDVRTQKTGWRKLAPTFAETHGYRA